MSELPQLVVRLDFPGNEIASAVRRQVQFNVILENVGNRQMPRIQITLNGPNQVGIVNKVRSIGYIPKGRQRKALFKIKGKSNGIFDMIVTVKRSKMVLATLPFKFRSGIGPEIPAAQPAIQEQPPAMDITSMTKCPFCDEETETNSKFCPNCGADLTQKKEIVSEGKICPSCGTSQASEALFCSECGWDLG